MQANAFETLIKNTPYLNDARGTIMTRNACRNPWVNEFDVSIAQSLGALGGLAGARVPSLDNLQVRLDIVDFGNLLNRNWGQQALSDQGNTCGQICSATTLLTHTINVLTGPAGSQMQGVFTFDPDVHGVRRGQRVVELPHAAVAAVQLLIDASR